MAANVTIDYSAFSDRRIAYLGELAGYSTMEALGRLASLWSRCTELQTDRPGVHEIRACLGPRGDEFLLECGLGEDDGDGVRVRGCTGRHEWYANVRPGAPRQTAGGKARAAKAQRDAKGRLLPSSKRSQQRGDAGEVLDVAGPATGQQASNVPASDPDLDPRSEALPPARVIPGGTEPGPLPRDWEPDRSDPEVVVAEEMAQGKGVAVVAELAKFRAWARAENVTRADWDAAWVKWLISAYPPTRREAELQAEAKRTERARARRAQERRAPLLAVPDADRCQPGDGAAALKVLRGGGTEP